MTIKKRHLESLASLSSESLETLNRIWNQVDETTHKVVEKLDYVDPEDTERMLKELTALQKRQSTENMEEYDKRLWEEYDKR